MQDYGCLNKKILNRKVKKLCQIGSYLRDMREKDEAIYKVEEIYPSIVYMTDKYGKSVTFTYSECLLFFRNINDEDYDDFRAITPIEEDTYDA